MNQRLNHAVARNAFNNRINGLKSFPRMQPMHQIQSRTIASSLQTGQVFMERTKTLGIFQTAQRVANFRIFQGVKFAAQGVKSAFKRHPLALGTMFACTKAVMADLFAQTLIEKKSFDDLDLRRVVLFATLGIFYNGLCVYGIYAKFYPKLWPKVFENFHKWKTISKSLTQTTADVLIHATFLYFPFFYVLKACIFDGFSMDSAKGGLNKYFFENMFDDFKSTMSVWFPCNLIAFGYVPPYLRTPYMSTISFLWVLILSSTRGQAHPEEEFEIEIDLQMMHPHAHWDYPDHDHHNEIHVGDPHDHIIAAN
jgi:hypothetical protein